MIKNTPQPLVAFILVCWNNRDLLEECFEAIKRQDYDNYITIMVDNGSKDDSVNFTKKNFQWVNVIETNSNLGFTEGNNRAISYVLEKYPEVKYFVLLNTDARIRDDWLSTMISFALMKPKGAEFQSTTLDYYNHDIIDSTYIYLSRNGSGTQAGWRVPLSGSIGPFRVFGTNAAAVLISRQFLDTQPFKTVFDKNLFMYLEDVDLSARATVMGWDNYLVPGTFAYHMGSASSGKNPGFSLYMTYRNNLAVLLKNIPFILFIKMIPEIITADYRTIKHLRRISQGKNIKMVIKGRLIGVIRLPLFMPSIVKMHPYRKTISKEYIWQLMNQGRL